MDEPTTDTVNAGGELRRNPVSGKLTIVAPGRAARPQDDAAERPSSEAAEGTPERSRGARAACPFCPGNEGLTPPEIEARRPEGGAPDSPGWTLRVVPNKYPALAGRHEVIVFSPNHEAELEDLAPGDLTAFVACAQRRIAAQFDDGAAAATLVVNRGLASGASLEHPHAQLFATPVVPPLLQDELMESDRHRNRYGTCVVCDEVDGAGERLVFDGAYVAWVPAAPRFPYELWLTPAAHEADVRTADPELLGAALRRALVAVKTATAGAPSNLWVHTAPADLRAPFHWHVEIAPRLSGIAGFELGSDIAIVSVDPVAAAARLRAGASAPPLR
jgi:UDPglucose--hexose-1-phosphate uridylyltransferase